MIVCRHKRYMYYMNKCSYIEHFSLTRSTVSFSYVASFNSAQKLLHAFMCAANYEYVPISPYGLADSPAFPNACNVSWSYLLSK